jgi:hypothetical protein
VISAEAVNKIGEKRGFVTPVPGPLQASAPAGGARVPPDGAIDVRAGAGAVC